MFPDVDLPKDCSGEYDCVLAQMDTFADRMCACAPKDQACVNKVSQDMTTWGQSMAKQDMVKVQPTSDQIALVQESTKRMAT